MTAVDLVNQPRQLAIRQPIITVHAPDIYTGAVLYPGFPGRHDSTVFLVDHLHKGIPFGVAIRNGRGSICGAVVHHDNLDIGGVIAPLQDRGDAMVHVLGGVIRGNTECYDFMHGRR